MSVETIVAFIEREAAEEAARLVSEATERAARRVAAAEGSAAAQVAAACERAEPVIRSRAARRVNAVRLRVLERQAVTDAGRIEAVFAAAAARLDSIASGAEPARWEAAIGRLAGDAVASAGDRPIVRVRSRDVNAIRAIVAARGGRVEPMAEGAAAPGVIVEDGDGRLTVDATIGARLARAHGRLAGDVARSLGVGR